MPTVTVVGLKDAPVTLGAATAVALAVALVPATPNELYGVMVQVLVPGADIPMPPVLFTTVPE